MKKQKLNLFITLSIILGIAACHPKPKLVESEPNVNSETVDNYERPIDTEHIVGMSENAQHKVKVEEILNTEKYSYLNVTEDGEKFWIAIPRKEIEIGSTYYYKGGLLKRNFESKEYNRVFETIYLVSNVTSQPINSSEPAVKGAIAEHGTNTRESINVEPAEGSINLSELFSNPSNYQGKLVKITGKCVKFNPMIMNRNWAHIQDGSGDNLDLTVTTSQNIPLNAVVTIEGIIELNRDFGAGYKYDIIMEKAVLK